MNTARDKIIAAAELACGLLWMMADHRHPHTKIAFVKLLDALGGPGSEGLGRAIKRAIDAGYEADHPPGATSWAGKKPEENPINELALFAGAGGGILGGYLLGWRTVCAVARSRM